MKRNETEITQDSKVGMTVYALISTAISLVIATAFFLGIYYKMDARISMLEKEREETKIQVNNLIKSINANNKAQKKLILFLSVKFGVVIDADNDVEPER